MDDYISAPIPVLARTESTLYFGSLACSGGVSTVTRYVVKKPTGTLTIPGLANGKIAFFSHSDNPRKRNGRCRRHEQLAAQRPWTDA